VISRGLRAPGADERARSTSSAQLLAKRGVGERLGDEIEERTGFETRVTVLGHIQRGAPYATRSHPATRFGSSSRRSKPASSAEAALPARRGDRLLVKEATAEAQDGDARVYDVAKRSSAKAK